MLSSFTVGQRRRLAVVLICLVAALLAWRHFGSRPPSLPPLDATPAPLVPRTAPRPVASRRLVVDVVGAVRAAGLYRLPEGSRVADAVQAAGGLTARADPLLVNLAAPLADGEQVVVAAHGSAGAAAPAAAGAPSAPVDLNSASAEQLDALPGVGPVTAQKIVAYRQQHGPFTSVDGLDAIPGIGPSRIADLEGLVTP